MGHSLPGKDNAVDLRIVALVSWASVWSPGLALASSATMYRVLLRGSGLLMIMFNNFILGGKHTFYVLGDSVPECRVKGTCKVLHPFGVDFQEQHSTAEDRSYSRLWVSKHAFVQVTWGLCLESVCEPHYLLVFINLSCDSSLEVRAASPAPTSILAPNGCYIETSVKGLGRYLQKLWMGGLWLESDLWVSFIFAKTLFLKVWLNCPNLKIRRFI